MLSIKEYARKCGKTEQAVYKQIKAQKNKERLKGHIIRESGKQWLDEEAIKILDESREQNPVVVMEMNRDDQIRELEAECEQYKAKILELQETVIQKQDQIIQLQQNQRGIMDLERELKNHKMLLTEKIQQYEAEREREERARHRCNELENNINALERKLFEEQERKLTLKERIFGKKEKF